jgi:hypothetical protein
MRRPDVRTLTGEGAVADVKGFDLMDSKGLAERAAREEREFNEQCPWKLNKETLVLCVEDDGDRSYYEIDLEDCTSSAGALDRIAQVSQKTWIDDATLGALVRKMDQVLSLQATLCGGGN